MGAALIGLLGVVVGGLLIGATAAWNAHADRVRQKRAAARLIWAALFEISALADAATQTGRPMVRDEDSERLEAAWTTYSQPLALDVSSQEFIDVVFGFLAARQVVSLRPGPQDDVSYVPVMLKQLLLPLNHALGLLDKMSRTENNSRSKSRS